MSRFSGTRPSAGVIIGMLALVMAVAVPALAGSATQGKITKEKVKTIIQNVAPSLDVNSANTANSAKTADSANTANTADRAKTADSATTADSAKTADTAKIATNVLSAMVTANGTMLGSIPAGATVDPVAFQGIRGVKFPRDITGCTISASLATNSNSQIPAGEIDVGVGSTRELVIETYDSTGSLAFRGFYVQAICPG